MDFDDEVVSALPGASSRAEAPLPSLLTSEAGVPPFPPSAARRLTRERTRAPAQCRCPAPPSAAFHQRLHFEQLDQRAAARQRAVALEQRLLLDRLELEILRQRVDQFVVRHLLRQAALGERAAEERGQQRFELLAFCFEQLGRLAESAARQAARSMPGGRATSMTACSSPTMRKRSRPRSTMLNRPSDSRST